MWFPESTNPQTSRQRFVSRRYRDIIWIVVLFILAVTLVSSISIKLYPGSWMPLLIADAVALAAAYYFYILSETRAIRLRCPGCEQIIFSNTPWTCGVCGEANKNSNDFPFVHRCEKCKSEAKAYRCHLCHEVIHLSEDSDSDNCASIFVRPEADPHIARVKRLREQKEVKDLRRETAVVEEDLLKVQKRLRTEKQAPKTAKEDLEARVGSIMEDEEAEAELRALYKSKYKGSMQRRMLAALKQAFDQRRANRL
jgi:hypothetical protein